jgi:hypothetical protein
LAQTAGSARPVVRIAVAQDVAQVEHLMFRWRT